MSVRTLFRSWLRWLRPKTATPIRRSSRLNLETLEDRCVMDAAMYLMGPYAPPTYEAPTTTYVASPSLTPTYTAPTTTAPTTTALTPTYTDPVYSAPAPEPYSINYAPPPGGTSTIEPTPAPQAPSLHITGISDDNGSSSSDFLTNDTTLTVFGTGTPGLNVYVMGKPAPVVVAEDGTWSAALDQQFNEGTHMISAWTISASGQSAFDTCSVTIDLTAPVATLVAPAYTADATTDVYVSMPSNWQADSDGTIYIDVDLNGDGAWEGSELGIASGAAAEDGTAKLTLASVSPGTYQIRARTPDAAGNQGLSAEATLTVLANEVERMPLYFEENAGQADEAVLYMARGHNYTIFLTSNGPVLALEAEVEVPVNEEPAPGSPAMPMPGYDPYATPVVGPIYVPMPGPMPMPEAPPVETELRRVVVPLGFELQWANTDATVFALDELYAKSNYYQGESEYTDIANFREIRYQDVYDGIDIAYQGDGNDLQFQFLVDPWADARRISLDYTGAEDVEISDSGDLILTLPGGGQVVQSAPILYQDIDGERVSVEGGYVLNWDGTVGFEIGAYDASHALVIDPTLRFSTYIGGSSNEDSSGSGVAMDIDGNDIYITGTTFSTNFPANSSGVFQTSNNGNADVFVFRANSSGARQYATYFGGAGADIGRGIDVDNDNAYVTGSTASTDFPNSSGVVQTSNGGNTDAFIFRLNSSGTRNFATYLGGSGDDIGWDIEVDTGFFGSRNDVYVTGQTSSSNLNTNSGAFDTSANGGIDIFVGKFNITGTTRDYLTYLGGSSNDVAYAIDRDDNEVYIAGYTDSNDFATRSAFQSSSGGGRDAIVAKFNSSGSQLRFSTYLGGSGNEEAYDVVESNGDRPVVTGYTTSGNFPTTTSRFQGDQGGTDAFLTRLNSSGSSLNQSTYLGGSGDDFGRSVRVDGSGRYYIAGNTNSTDFPLNQSLQGALAGNDDVFVTVLSSTMNRSQTSTYFGGTGSDVGYDLRLLGGDIVVAGVTGSNNFPATGGAFQTSNAGGTDAFAFRFTPTLQTGPPPGGGGGFVNPGADVFEQNNTSDRASFLGTLETGDAQDFSDLSINIQDGLIDRDWYRWTIGSSGTFNVNLSSINSAGDLHVRVYRRVGNVLVEIASSTQTGSVDSQAAAAGVSAGDEIYVWVFGFNFATGSYDLQVSLT